MPCPLCRTKFTIPADGLSGTPKNYDMEKLLSARKLSAGEDAGQREGGFVLCDVCSSEAASSAPPATKRCLECQQNYCDQCSRSHTKIKAAASHVVVPVDLQNQVKSDREKITELLNKTEALLRGGTAGDVTKSANSLHSRAKELTTSDVIGHVDNVLHSLNVTFTPSTHAVDENRVGTICEEGLYDCRSLNIFVTTGPFV